MCVCVCACVIQLRMCSFEVVFATIESKKSKQLNSTTTQHDPLESLLLIHPSNMVVCCDPPGYVPDRPHPHSFRAVICTDTIKVHCLPESFKLFLDGPRIPQGDVTLPWYFVSESWWGAGKVGAGDGGRRRSDGVDEATSQPRMVSHPHPPHPVFPVSALALWKSERVDLPSPPPHTCRTVDPLASPPRVANHRAQRSAPSLPPQNCTLIPQASTRGGQAHTHSTAPTFASLFPLFLCSWTLLAVDHCRSLFVLAPCAPSKRSRLGLLGIQL